MMGEALFFENGGNKLKKLAIPFALAFVAALMGYNQTTPSQGGRTHDVRILGLRRLLYQWLQG